MLTPERSGAFRRDVKRAQKRGKDMAKLRPHPAAARTNRVAAGALLLARTGTHADLFDE